MNKLMEYMEQWVEYFETEYDCSKEEAIDCMEQVLGNESFTVHMHIAAPIIAEDFMNLEKRTKS